MKDSHKRNQFPSRRISIVPSCHSAIGQNESHDQFSFTICIKYTNWLNIYFQINVCNQISAYHFDVYDSDVSAL